MKKSSLLLLLLAFCINASFAQSVGTTEGVFNVSDMGAANYSIPIKVPDGINGMQPTLAISYSSQSGNGPLGMGWSISGLSAITRTGNTIYHDSKVNGISLSNSDKFTLDGNRLMVTGGTYGASASKYRTEVETFKEITANGTLGTGPQSFTVTDQNGWTYEYGNTSNSRQVPVGKTEAIAWYLNKVTDLNGNYMLYEYNNIDGNVLPQFVKYNCNLNTGLTYQSYIYFSYTTGTDPTTSYVAGGSVKSTKRINKISAVQKVGSVWYYYRSYIPEYTDDFYTHLTKITEKGAKELEALNPTEFTYGNTVSQATYTNMQSLQSPDANVAFATGDYNGDGKSDILKFSNQNSNGAFKLYLNTTTSQVNTFIESQSSILQSSSSINNNFNSLDEQANANAIDYNGDGKDDLFYMQSQYYEDCHCVSNKQAFFIYTSNGNSLSPLDRKIVSTAYPGSNDGFGNMTPLTGDFDGDGKSEILVVNAYPLVNTNPSYLIGEKYLTATTTTGPNSNTTTPYPVYVAKNLGQIPFAGVNNPSGPNSNDVYGRAKLFTIDYDGDGKNEVLVIAKDQNNNSHAKIFKLNVTFNSSNNPVIGSPVFVEVADNGYPSVWHTVLTGDFNGDRITDVLTYFADNTQIVGWEIGYGKGNGNFDIKTGPNLVYKPYYATNSQHKDTLRPIIIADFNGDGKDDIYDYIEVPQTQNPIPAKIFYSWRNNVFYDEVVNASDGRYAKNYYLGDFNGDGNADLFTKHYSHYVPNIFNIRTNETRHLLSKVKNGVGSETKINYLSLTNNTQYYNQTANSYAYPYIQRTLPLKIVSSVNSDNGFDATGNTITYTYRGLKFHAQGKGLLGFDNIRMYNVATRMVTEKQFAVNNTYAFPYLQASYTKYNWPASPEEVLNYQINTYGFYPYGDKRIFPYQITSQQGNSLTSEVTNVTNNYVFPSGGVIPQGVVYSKDIGKPFSITTNKGNGLEITTQNFSYPNSSTFNSGGTTYTPVWVYSKPSKIVTTNTRQGQTSYSRTAAFTYDNTTGKLTQTVSDLGTTNESLTGFLYNSYGNIWRKLTAASGLPVKRTYMIYDASNRYVTESYPGDFPAIKNKATYDALTGNKLTEIVPDGFTTTYTYDGFGRVKTSSDNNGLNTTTTYNWGYSLPGDNLSYYGAAYYISSTSNTGATNHILYDRLGREMKNKNKNFQNQWVSTRKIYNTTTGQLTSVTKPYFDNASPQYINYTYDAYGRLTKAAAPEGNITYTYSPASSNYYTVSTVDPGGQTTTVKTDASGVKINTSDAQNNVLGYIYHSNGNVKSVTNGNNTLQTYTYDAFNHLTERWDPNYGTYKYTYDAYGQMTKQTDPKNQEYTFKYDVLGRMYQKTGPEGNYDYTFENNAGTNCGKMTKLSGPEGKITYDYGMGDKINNVTYDDNGLANSLTGSSYYGNYSYSYGYNGYGQLGSKYYSTGLGFTYAYGSNGELTTINDVNTGTTFYQKQSENAAGQTTAYWQSSGYTNNAITTENTYDSYNLLMGQKTTLSNANIIRNMAYNFDAATGNLWSRKDNKYGLEEIFNYDDLNRLTKVINSMNSSVAPDFGYTNNGNITYKKDAGNFAYDQANRLTEITSDQNIPHASQELTYTPFDKVSTINEGDYHTGFHYWPDGSRSMMVTTNNITGTQEYKIYAPDMEVEYNTATGKEDFYTYVQGPEGNVIGMQTFELWGIANHFVLTDHLGSFTQIVDDWDNIEEEKSFDAWGRLRDPQNWQPYASNIDAGQPQQLFDRGYTGHEHLAYYGIVNMNGRLYDPVMGRMFSADPALQQSDNFQNYNRYTYCLNNPLKYTDPSGNFFTWSMNGSGFSLGFNLTPIGIPVGAGVNFGDNMGIYGEVGLRVGGSGFGSGLTASQSINYNLSQKSFNTTSSAGAYASLGMFNAGANISKTYDITNDKWENTNWAISAGLGFGDQRSGVGFSISYGSGGFSYGLSGVDDPWAWKHNPTYDPSRWNDGGTTQSTNNCYSYALDEINNGNYWGLQPGEAGGNPLTGASDVTLDRVTKAALSDGRIKRPNIWNKLGFGRRGYYSAYLVVENGVDYHWYRQDKGGYWSHKPGITPVRNVDASGRLIYNPARGNHNYPAVNYNNGGILLWIKQ